MIDKCKKAAIVSKVNGKHYTEYVKEINKLKKENKIEQAIVLLKDCIKALEAEAKIMNWSLAPWYDEQLAICYRKIKQKEHEINILEYYLNQKNGNHFPWFEERLKKLKENRNDCSIRKRKSTNISDC